MTALLADMAAWPFFVVFGGMIAAGVFGAVGIVWLGVWFFRRARPPQNAVEEDSP